MFLIPCFLAGDLLLHILSSKQFLPWIFMSVLRAFLFLTIISLPFISNAQKVLGEGTVVYKAVLTKPDGSRKEGTYTITVKNKQVRKDLKIGSDFENVQIFDNTEKAYILRSMNDKNFAVEMSMADLLKKNERYYDPEIKDAAESKNIAGMKAQKAVITYKDGSTAELFYTKEWKADIPFAFERYRGLNGFPVAFDYKNDQGAVINFEVLTLDENVVESSNFKIPNGYKVISGEEYKKLQTK